VSRAGRVDFDGTDGVPPVHALLVEIAELGPPRRPAEFGLLPHSVLDLDPVVAGAVGVDAGKHRHLEQSRRGVVDLLGSRNEVRADPSQFRVGLELRQLVADESIQHVEDEVVDVPVLSDEVERFPQGPVHAVRGAFGGSDELPHHVRLSLGSLVIAAVALVLERVALLCPGSLGLAFVGDAEKDHGAAHRVTSGSRSPS
jgi:hypothetical protein